MKVYADAYKYRNDEKKRIEIFEAYAQQTLGLTAVHPASNNQGDLILPDVVEPEGTLPFSDVYSTAYCPCSKRLVECNDLQKDLQRLVNAVQIHKCGNYCLKKVKDGKRYCRSGCGKEEKYGSQQTPGFKLTKVSTIERDMNGTFKLKLSRNSQRMIQTSLYLLPVWRANCDVQLLLYDSNPSNPDLSEIAKVTDYVVSYACKGHSSTEMETQVLNTLIQK